jgi:putative two-component system response regulator
LIIQKLGIATEYKDNDTGFHIARMSNYCKLLAITCELLDEEVESIYNASPMHDIGKIGISDSVLLNLVN